MERERRSLFVEGRLAVFVARRQRVAATVAVEGEEADGEAERVQDLVLHRRDEHVQFGQLRADAARAQVGVARDRPEQQ